MPFPWAYLLLLIPAAPLACGDFRRREVAVVWLAVLGAGAFGVKWGTEGIGEALICTAVNICTLLFFVAVMIFYLFLRRRPLQEFFVRWFGAGDVVMMLAVTPLFIPAGYVRFLLAANFAALVWWCVRRPATLPLAGFMALTFAVYVVFKTAGLWT